MAQPVKIAPVIYRSRAVAFRAVFLWAAFMCFNTSTLHAQCCASGVNLLAGYNPNFTDTFSTVPPGFTTSNTYAPQPTGAGYYYIIISRNYGACGATPQFDHTYGDSAGRYMWFDTPFWASEADPAIAWMPYNPLLPLAQQNLISVTPNTTYVFSVWVRDLAREDNCISGGAPIAGLRINGVDVGQINLGLITTPCCPAWTLLCTLWNSGSDTTALLHVESRTGNGFTDLGIDGLYFGVQTPGGPTLNIGNDTSVCTGDTILLQASLPDASYLWSTGSNDSAITVTSSGTYSVQVWQNACEVTDTVNVALKTFQPATLGHDTALCCGSSLVLNAFMPGATYHWQDSSSASTYTVTQGGNYAVTITDSGCVAVDTVSVSLITAAPVYISADTSVICPNDSVQICAPTGYTAYLWNTGDSTVCIYTSLQGSYAVAATDTSGCTAVSNHVSVTVLHPPVISVTAGSDTVGVCSGDSVQLCTEAGYAIYEWSTGQSANCINIHAAGFYVVTVTDFNGCTSAASDSISASGGATPIAIAANKTTICAGDSAQICAPPGYVLYQWNTGDTGNCILTPYAGNYYVIVTEAGNCTASSNRVDIGIYPPSPVTVSVNGDTLTAYSYNSYQWLLNGEPIAGATSSIYIANAQGTYTLQITDTNGCVATSSPILITGMAGELSENNITLYPNPSAGAWQLTVPAQLIGSLEEVVDAAGRIIFKSEIRSTKSEIAIPNMASGVYELCITAPGYYLVRKLVKM